MNAVANQVKCTFGSMFMYIDLKQLSLIIIYVGIIITLPSVANNSCPQSIILMGEDWRFKINLPL